MKFRNYLVLFVLVLFFALISLSSPQGEKKRNPQETFNLHIDEKNAKLMEKFNADDFDGMAESLGENTVLVKPNGKRIREKKLIKEFFKNAKKMGKWEEVTLEKTHAIVIEHKFVIFGQKYSHIGIEVSKFFFSGSPRRSEPGFITNVWLHRDECDWDL